MLIAQIVFDDFTDVDVFLAWDLLNRVRVRARRPDWRVELLGTEAQHRSVSGLTLPMHGRIEEAAAADAVLFASGPATRELRFDREYLARFALDPTRQLIGSMCSGALLLAALGLLEGKRATTHPTAAPLLREAGIEVVDAPFVRQGNIATAAACLAGVELSAWVIEVLLGKDARDAVLAEVQPVGRPFQPADPPFQPAAESPLEPSGDALYRGSCLCKAIEYELHAELGDFGYCHCTSCRKASGTAHGSNSPVDRARFRLLRGASVLREHESSPGKFRTFCSSCGSPIYAYLASSPDVLRIRLGSLDTPFTKQARAHTFVSDKAPWEDIVDEVPQFAEWAPRSVLHQRGSRQRET
ncbi:GFA family protein [Pendulispora albinea]|uniref:GFA family protein n=1 Tax=Pendulispora albinea TaxID=2741071 RepID=A0ABZ2LUG5_9BACT